MIVKSLAEVLGLKTPEFFDLVDLLADISVIFEDHLDFSLFIASKFRPCIIIDLSKIIISYCWSSQHISEGLIACLSDLLPSAFKLITGKLISSQFALILEKEGYIRKQAGKKRAFEVVAEGEQTAENKAEEPDRPDVVVVPVVGRVAAGTPIL